MPRFPKPFFKKARGVWYVEINRRQISLGPNREQAFQRYHELMAQPNERKVSADLLAVVVDAFLEWVQRNRSDETYEWYRYRLERFVQKYPDLKTTEIRPYHVETWADGYDIAVTTRRNYLRSVKRCLIWARKQGYIDQNPIADLEIPSAQHREIAIEQAEFDRMLGFVRNDAFRDLVVTTWEIGCRPQELLRVEARHVDLAHQRWVFPKSEEKMKRFVRVIYLTDEALAITQRLMETHADGPLFRNNNGTSWSTEAVNCGFTALQIRMGQEAMRSAGESIPEERILAMVSRLEPTKTVKGRVVEKRPAELRGEAKRKLTYKRARELAPRYSLYALRHSWATNALKRGVDPLTVAILMGHQDPSMLARVYQHLSLSPNHLLEQARKAAG
jgi:integrase